MSSWGMPPRWWFFTSQKTNVVYTGIDDPVRNHGHMAYEFQLQTNYHYNFNL